MDQDSDTRSICEYPFQNLPILTLYVLPHFHIYNTGYWLNEKRSVPDEYAMAENLALIFSVPIERSQEVIQQIFFIFENWVPGHLTPSQIDEDDAMTVPS